MPLGRNSLLETLVLTGAVTTLLLAGFPGVVALALALVLWVGLWANGRDRWLTGFLLIAAVGLVGYDAVQRHRSFDPELKKQAVERQFRGLWSDLDRRAHDAARDLEGWSEGDPGSVDPFELLVDRARGAGAERLTFLLVDPSGVVRAWAGVGLLHDLEEQALPSSGRVFRLGFQSATVASVSRIPGVGSPGRVVVGVSLFTRDLPVRDRLLGPIRWTVFEPGDVVPSELIEIDLGGGPTVAIQDWTRRATPQATVWTSRPRRWGAVALALALVVLYASRPATGRYRPVLLAAAALAAAWAARFEPATATALVSAAFVGALGWRWGAKPADRRWTPSPALVGLVGAAAVGVVAWQAQRPQEPLDLGSFLLPGLEPFAWRLVLVGLTLAWLGWIRSAREAAEKGSGWWSTLALGTLLLAAAIHDQHAGLVAILIGIGAVASAIWVSRQRAPLGPAAGMILGILAALLASTTWESSYRVNLKYHLNFRVLPSLASPGAGEREQIRLSLARHFGELDLASLVLPNPAGLDAQDLGLAIWRGSPLAVHGGLSAVTARPFGDRHSSFSYGLPLAGNGDVDWAPTRWRKVEEPSPEGRVVSGSTRLLHGGRPWAEVSYTLLMRPGFHLTSQRIENFAAGLLQGGPGPFRPASRLIQPAHYGFYSPDGEPLETALPGVELPLERLAEAPGSRVGTPSGSFFGFAAHEIDGFRVLLLPLLGPVAALERVGTHAVAVLLVLALAVLFGRLCALHRMPTIAALSSVFRSYSKRMLIVTGLLLLVPILLLDTFALGVIGEHLREEQRVAGESALTAAQRVLGEYILALDPGFGIESVLDDELLSWLSRVVQHEINVYWGSSVYASSKSELFSAGLLPKRIPGEIFAELALGEAEFATRVNQAGNTDYLEIYGPLSIPGEERGTNRLFLSVPLLAQQVETAAELGSLRRKLFLAGAALVLLLLAVGSRLARGFTAPLVDIVRGTQRIADGAASIDLQPTDTELATLVEAIDRMARGIALGRQRLMREKALVERVIDNVNSGVVSIDEPGRVLLLNQVARRLLQAEVGDFLKGVLARTERLAPVAEFLERAGTEPKLETVKLLDAEDEEAEWSLVWVPLPGEGDPAGLFIVEDVTEVLRGQRLEAWAEMARIIAHEIKNPLTPIRLSAEHMREVYSERPEEFSRVFERCTRNILEQVDELQQISTEFSAYSRLPKIEPKEGDLGEAVRKIVEGYQAAAPDDLRLEIDVSLAEFSIRFDGKLIGRALRNLIENALRATSNGGGVVVIVERSGKRASIRVLDGGPGVSTELLPRIFDPYFSTHDSGTGLGLPIARQIAEEHGGGIHARNRPAGGLEVELWIPIGSPTG